MTPIELQTAIALGREQRGTEFKGPGSSTDKSFLAKVLRAILGMANKPDGGVVVIGVEDNGTSLIEKGCSQGEIDTWGYDQTRTHLSNYADPFVDVDVEVLTLNGKRYVVLSVLQFEELPAICKRDYNTVLRNGALYARRKGGRNETVEVPSHVEMREILDRAAEAGARRIVEQMYRVGAVSAPGPTAPAEPADAQRFAEETKDLP